MVDIFHSRRSNYFKCDYWIRDERDAAGTASQWVLENNKSGSFYAKPVSSKQNSINVVSGVWALDTNRLAIETDDDVDGLCRGSVIKFNEQLWLVEMVGSDFHLKESEFSKHTHYKRIIHITRS